MTKTTDTAMQRRCMRQNRVARKVRQLFPEGTRVRGVVGGQTGTVVRHLPMMNAQGGVLVVRWDSGHEGRVSPSTVAKEQA